MYQLVTIDANNQPLLIKNAYLPKPTATLIGAVRPDGTSIVIDGNGVISTPGGGGGAVVRLNGTTVNPIANFRNNVLTNNAVNTWSVDQGNIEAIPSLYSVDASALFTKVLVQGSATATVANGVLTITVFGNNPPPTIVSSWGSGGATKDQYSAFPTVNSQSIILAITITNDLPLTITSITVGGTALTGPFTVTGAFPNYSVTVAIGAISSTVQINGGAVDVMGTLNSQAFTAAGGTLNTLAPVPFTISLSAFYASAILPYYTTTNTLNYSYALSNGTVSTRAGVITPTGGSAQNAPNASGSFAAQPINGGTITGSATGNGTRGAGSSTVNFNSAFAAIPTYIPAFYANPTSSSSTPPVFTTASLQTARGASGSTITYALALASTNYLWIAVPSSIPLSKLQNVNPPFPNSQFTPDVTAPNQTIAGQVFNVYGATNISINNAAVILISP